MKEFYFFIWIMVIMVKLRIIFYIIFLQEWEDIFLLIFCSFQFEICVILVCDSCILLENIIDLCSFIVFFVGFFKIAVVSFCWFFFMFSDIVFIMLEICVMFIFQRTKIQYYYNKKKNLFYFERWIFVFLGFWINGQFGVFLFGLIRVEFYVFLFCFQ